MARLISTISNHISRQTLSIYILFVLFILTQNVATILDTISDHTNHEVGQVALAYRFWQQTPDVGGNCLIQIDLYSITIPSCAKYHLGEEIKIVGKHDPSTDRGIFGQKRLNVQAIYHNNLEEASGLNLIWFSLENISLLQSYIKKQLQEYLSPIMNTAVSHLILAAQAGGDDLLNIFFPQPSGRPATAVIKPSLYISVILAEAVGVVLGSFGSKRLICTITLVCCVFLDAISGFTLALNRVAILILLEFAEIIAFRQPHHFQNFLFSFLILLSIAPSLIFGSSFQFSFLASLGARLFLPLWFQQSQKRQKRPLALLKSNLLSPTRCRRVLNTIFKTILNALVLALSLQIFTLPLSLYQFSTFSLRDFAFQSLILFVLPCLLLISLFCLFSALFWPPMLILINIFCSGLFAAFASLGRNWTKLPGLTVYLPLSLWQVFICWGIAGCFYLFYYNRIRGGNLND